MTAPAARKQPTELYQEWRRDKVIENLWNDYKLTLGDLDDYRYCGGNREGKHGRLLYFKLMFGSSPLPPNRRECVCGEPIVEQCYICPNTDTASVDEIVVVGNDCISKWANVAHGRTCEQCGDIHHNRSFNLCNEHIKAKMKISRRFYKLVFNRYFAKTITQKQIERRRVQTATRYVTKEESRSLMQTCLHVLVTKLGVVNKWRYVARQYSKQRTRIAKLRNFKHLRDQENARVVQLLFKQCKVAWVMKYCDKRDGCTPPNPTIRKAVLHIMDNRNVRMPFGKLKGKTYQEFYARSTMGHKMYFLAIQNPDDQIKSIVEYIKQATLLSRAGYTFNIPEHIKTSVNPNHSMLTTTYC